MKKNVLVITGSRSEFGLLRSTIDRLKKSQLLSVKLLVTGMHTLPMLGNTYREVEKSYQIDCIVSLTETASMIDWLTEEIRGIKTYCENEKIDCMLLLGDRDEMLAGAIVASHLGIPIAHIHGGDISGLTTADHTMRNAITQFARFHFPATKKSAERIKKMKGNEHIYMVGAPGLDNCISLPFVEKSNLAKKYKLATEKNWSLVILHPEPLEKIISPEKQIELLSEAIQSLDGEIIWIYPNSDTGYQSIIQKFSTIQNNQVHFIASIPRDDFLQLLRCSDLLIGNSSAGIIESAFFKKPTINIGGRQKGRESVANVINVDFDVSHIKKALAKAQSIFFKTSIQHIISPYGEGNTGKKIVSHLEKLI